MRYYLTKHALSHGIYLVFEVQHYSGKCIRYNYKLGDDVGTLGDDLFKTKKEAIAKAEKMRLEKIKELKEQIKQLENIKTFF